MVLAVSVTMLHGLYDPRVDNDKIFAIIGPSFQTIVGGFVGLLSGLALGRKTDGEETQKQSPKDDA